MWESRCNFKTQPVNVSRPSAADGRLLNNFDNAVVAVEGLWVYVMSQTRLREGDQQQEKQVQGEGSRGWGRRRQCVLNLHTHSSRLHIISLAKDLPSQTPPAPCTSPIPAQCMAGVTLCLPYWTTNSKRPWATPVLLTILP